MRPSISYGGDLPDDPDHPLTLGDALVRAAQRFPQAGLHIAPDGFQTYPQLLAAASRVATGLREAGARHGDYAVLRIGDDQYFPVFWGCVLSGVIPVTTGAPPGYEQDSPALTAITHTWDRLGRPLVLGGSGEVAGLRRLPLSGSVVDVAELLAAAESRPAPAAGPDDVAMLQLSSGSTGHPKIIQITHRGVSEYAIGARTLLDVRAGDVLLNWLPLDHVAGLMLYHLGGVFLGATTVQAATDPILADPPHWLELMEQYRATHGWAPNFAYRLVADALATSPGRRFDLSRVRRMVSGGEQCTPETFTAFVQACRPFGVSEAVMAPGWGMSETCTGITFASFGEPYCVQGDLLSVGPPAPGTTLRIVDGEQTVVPEGEVGRLQVRSARITPGYIDDPEADRIAFPEPGWLDSGDLAYMVDGRITVTGRAKDLVILNGHNYPCHEIERVAHDVDGIADRLVAACGVPDEHSGTERLVVFYAPAAGADHRSVKAAISAAIGRRLHLPVADVVAVPVEQFPRTGSGKIQRARLRDRYQARPPDPAPAAVPHERAVAAYPDVHRVVLEAVAALAGGPVDPQRAFYELGLGSVQMVQLRARLEEELGRPVPQPALFAHPTVQALATHLATGSEPGAGPTPQRPQADQRIAIVGMACRFPGADGVGQYWANLTGGVSSIRHFTKADLAAAGLPETLTGDPDFVAASGALDDLTGFDAGFFGVSAREAELLDPQQRLFLQICHHALEDAGLAGPTDLRIGLYAGSGMNLYPHHTYLRNNLAAAATSADPATSIGAALGNQPDFLATRVAYRLGLTGPAVNVQTACSTSLVAVHLAAQALLAGEADVAVAGASAIHVPQVTGYHYSPDSILSPDGTCRPFDAAAAGTVGGNGVAAVVLKPLANAMADGDAIHAVLLGSAINNDGATKVGFTAPGLSGQVKVIQAALQRAQVAPETVGYVEAHGTGTALGDPIEFAALSQAYPGGPRHLGSVKANLGHLDSCAGMAGLIKAILVVREGVIPPQINFTAPNPAVDLDRGQFTIATRRSTWPQQASPRRAGVSALGVGGTNAHVIVEQPPPPTAPVEGEAPGLLPLSAADPVALTQLADAYAEEIGVLPHADVVVSAATGRRHLRHRAVALGSSTADLARQLAQPQQLIRGEVPLAGIGPVAFAYPGQGTDPQRGFTLAARFAPVGRWWRLLPAHVAARLRDGDRATDVVQPALVALGLGLTDLWRSWGVRPGSVLGHSVGELTALAAAGGLSGQDAVHIAAARGRLMQQLPAGAMAAVFAPRAAVDELLAATPGLELAAVNAAEQSVVAGPPDAVDRAAASGVPMRRLGVRRAFHTSAVDAILDEFRQVLAEVDFRPITVPFAGGVDGTVREPGWIPTAEYLCRQARRPVLFADAVGAIPTGGTTVVEAGPDAVLTGIAGMTGDLRWIASQPAGSPPVAGIWQAAAQLYCAGADLDWPAMTAGSGGRRVRLPRYPFQHRTYWVTAAAAAAPVPTGDDGVATARETAVTATPAAEANQTDAGLVARIVTMTAAKIGLEPAQVGPGDTFFSIGADSLLLVSLAREVQAEFGVRVPVRDLFDEVNTPARLAAVVAAATGGPPAAQPAMVSVAAAAPAAVVPSPPAGGEPRPATTGGAADGQPGAPADPALVDVVHRQLEIMQQQLALLGRPAAPAGPPVQVPGPAPAAVPAQRQAPGDDGEVDVSLYFFGDYPEGTAPERYQTILDATEYADRNGLHAVWIPERHFHSFGGLFPNPSVLAAALAARTTRLRINAGSVVLPLHHPIRVAEEWSVVDNLSGGRVGLGVAPGWHANDFVFHPEHFGRHKQVMYDNLDTVRRLWRGEAVPARSGSGDDIEVKLFPRPVQQLPPFYTAIVGNPDSYREAARRDIGVITNLMTQDVAQLADNIALYRRTRAEAGLDPDAGRVVVLLHAYLGDDLDTVRAEAFEPFCAYLRSSLSLLGQVVNSLGMNIDLASTPDDDVTFLLSQAYQRYCEQRALIGTPESCQKVLDAVLAAGADEISAFIDFGLPGERVIAGLPHLDRLRRMARRPARPRVVAAGPDRTAARPDLAHGRDVPAGAADAGDTAPLSPAQRRLWLTERLYPGRPAYNEAAAIRLEGPLDVAALQGALADVVARHAPLRTVYEQRDGEPVQVVRPEVPVACPVVDCRDEDEATRQALQEESRRLFDLTHGPVFAFRLLRVSDTRHVLVASFHHIAMDGRSYAVFAQDVSQFYRARLASRPPQLPALPVTYPEHARAQAAADGRREQDVAYWRQRLQQVPPALTLPSDIARPATSSAAGASVFFDLPAELADRVRQFGRTHQVTPFSTLITAFAVALSRTSGQQDFILGTGVTHRDEQTQDLLGFFVDTVPLRFDLSGDLSFAQLAVQVQRDAADAYAHAMPFDDLVAAAAPQREPGRHPLFDIAVEYETGGAFAFDLPGVTATPLPAGLDKAPVDLIVYLSHGATVRAHVEYRTDVFDERTIQRLFDLFQRIVDAATADPARAPAELAVPHSRLAGPQTPPASDLLHELVLRQAQLHPQATAIVDGDTRWTYDMLRERAAELAKEIVVEPGQIVALALPRSPDLIAAQLAVMMSGGVFLPLDPDHPEARLRRIIADSGARLTITTTGIVTEPEPARQTHGGAWCIYTSGSTGAPKGVLVPHSAAVNVVQWHVGELGLTPADHVAHQLAVSFDANLSEIYPALAAGATLHLAPDEIRTDPAALAAWWVLHGITTAFLPAPVAELVFAQAPQVRLRTLVVGGSALRQRPPATFGARVLNAYGPTENAIVTTAGTVTPDGRGPIDIGRPIANVTVDICDAAGAPVPPGAIGEIWASGRNLGSYLDDAPFAGGRYRTGDRARLRGDGSIEHLGRVDDQVKIGGHRVEPAEVSAALTAVTGVDQAIVIARHDRGPQPYLAAYVVGADPRPLLADLPTYLHPRTWTFLPSLPLTANGKIDVTALPAPDDTAAVGPQPTTAAEREVHDAWCAQIGAASLAVDVPFVQAGGDSLAAMRVAHQLGVAPHQVLEAAGIRSLARALPQPETAAVTFQQEQMWRRQQLTPEPAAVHIALRIDLTGHLDMAALTQALNGIVSRHAPLRSWLSDREGRVVQQITPTVHVNLEVSDVEPAAVDEWCVQQGRKPFTQAPMLRAALARHGVDQSVLLLVIHHLAADGWSVLRLVGELQEAYTAAREGRPPALPPLPVTYQEYAQRQRQTPPDPDVLRYWRTQMAGAPRKLQVPTDRPRPAAGTGGAEYAFTVPALVTAELTEFARTMNTTLYPVLAAAYAVLLWRRAGVDDVVLATLYAHRSGRDLDPLIGFLAGSVPIRLRPVPGMPFTDLVRQADTAVRDAMRHQPIHPVQLYRELDPQWSAGAPAPYGDMLFLWNPGMPTLTLPGLTARLSDQPLRSARRDIATVLAPDGDHLRGAVEYAVDLFDSSTIEAFCAEYVDILATRPDGG